LQSNLTFVFFDFPRAILALEHFKKMSDKFKIVERLFSFGTFCLVLFLAIYVPLNLEKETGSENSVEIVESVSRDSETSILCKNAAVATDRYIFFA
jgi:hypothetical protein